MDVEQESPLTKNARAISRLAKRSFQKFGGLTVRAKQTKERIGIQLSFRVPSTEVAEVVGALESANMLEHKTHLREFLRNDKLISEAIGSQYSSIMASRTLQEDLAAGKPVPLNVKLEDGPLDSFDVIWSARKRGLTGQLYGGPGKRLALRIEPVYKASSIGLYTVAPGRGRSHAVVSVTPNLDTLKEANAWLKEFLSHEGLSGLIGLREEIRLKEGGREFRRESRRGPGGPPTG